MKKLLNILFFLWIPVFYMYGESAMEHETILSDMVQPPRCLYKVLSVQHWQASQNKKIVLLSSDDASFIHLAKEDQLERIIAKYWSEAMQYVVLKLDASKLEGDLRCEVNPGGSTQYFHLYRGSIPFCSVMEARICYRSPLELSSSEERVLDVVQLGDPVLRQVARALSVQEILSPEIQTFIQNMKTTMRLTQGVGLAAPQVGASIQLVVIEDMDQSHLTSAQLVERDRRPVPFHVLINPHIYIEGKDRAEFFEGCLSIPQFIGVVSRATRVKVECFNEKAEPMVIEANGWYARILQHEIDHLNGILYIDRAILPTIMTVDAYTTLWKDKSVNEVIKGLRCGINRA